MKGLTHFSSCAWLDLCRELRFVHVNRSEDVLDSQYQKQGARRDVFLVLLMLHVILESWYTRCGFGHLSLSGFKVEARIGKLLILRGVAQPG